MIKDLSNEEHYTFKYKDEIESDEEILDRYRFMEAWPDIKKAARKVEWL